LVLAKDKVTHCWPNDWTSVCPKEAVPTALKGSFVEKVENDGVMI